MATQPLVTLDIRDTHYSIIRHRHGLVVRGVLRLTDLAALSAFARQLGYDLLDSRIARAAFATCVFVSTESSLAWRKSLGLPIVGGIARVGTSPFDAMLASAGIAVARPAASPEDDIEEARRRH